MQALKLSSTIFMHRATPLITEARKEGNARGLSGRTGSYF
jgi:hypothetical protein